MILAGLHYRLSRLPKLQYPSDQVVWPIVIKVVSFSSCRRLTVILTEIVIMIIGVKSEISFQTLNLRNWIPLLHFLLLDYCFVDAMISCSVRC